MSDSPTRLLDLPAGETGRVLMLRQLEEWARARSRLDDPADHEALHDFRVALRRLRSLLRAFRSPDDPLLPRRLRRRLRRLAQATGEGRDLEVQIEWVRSQLPEVVPRHRHGVRWLLSRMEERQRIANQRFLAVVARRFDPLQDRIRSALIDAGPDRPGAPAETPAAGARMGRVVRRWTAVLDSQIGSIRSITDDRQAHAARIAVKRLRYLLEPFEAELPAIHPVIARLKQLQDLLGDLHDAHRIAIALFEEFRAAAEEQAVASFLHALPWVETGHAIPSGKSRDPHPGLVALAERLGERGGSLFSRLRAEWLEGDALGQLAHQLRTLATRAARPAEPGVEIEHKFLLSALPAHVQSFPSEEIEQGWLPGDELVERLRHVRINGRNDWYRTVKAGRGVRRTEIEEATTLELFTALWPLTDGRRVTKRRYLIPEGELTWEIDQFLDRELALAEIELPGEDTPVEIPGWLAEYLVREVTGEPEYLNRTLAR